MFLIEGALGMSFEDMIMDYELTSFCEHKRTRNYEPFVQFVSFLKKYYGRNDSSWDSICRNFLIQCIDCNDDTIFSMKQILLEGY